MPFDFIKKWKYNAALSQVKLQLKQSALCQIGVFTDVSDANQIESLMKHIGTNTKSGDSKFLAYNNSESKIAVPNYYFKSDVKWWGQAQANSIDDFLKYSFKEVFIFVSDLAPHKSFIIQNIKAQFIAGTYVKGLDTYATFLVDTQETSLIEKYKIIQKTLDQLHLKNK